MERTATRSRRERCRFGLNATVRSRGVDLTRVRCNQVGPRAETDFELAQRMAVRLTKSEAGVQPDPVVLLDRGDELVLVDVAVLDRIVCDDGVE